VPDPLGTFIHTDAQSLNVLRLGEDRLTPIVKYTDYTTIGFPSVSPDGKSVAFAEQLPNNKAVKGLGTDIYVVGIDGKNLRQVAAHAKENEFLQSPQWVSTHEIIFDVRGPLNETQAYYRIDKLDVSTGARSTLIDNALRPSVSPDLKSLAYSVIDPSTGIDRLMLSTPELAPPTPLTPDDKRIALITYAVFSPDGSRLAFAAQDVQKSAGAAPSGGGRLHAQVSHPGAQDIWTVNRDGSGLRKIADLADANPSIAFGNDNNTVFVLGTTGFWKISLSAGTMQKLTARVPFGEIARVPQ
jgi:Tol biopolymer transport system component